MDAGSKDLLAELVEEMRLIRKILAYNSHIEIDGE